ncbi:MAG: dockerin type I repeat-containing protein, partial [Bacteroidaceae bacterium]|nr:dockerin type I repeat-containing protein [Bacteroidaceae bacterium]
MKKVFILKSVMVALSVLLSLHVYAQSSANWQVGQDVTAELGLGDCDGSFSGEWEMNEYETGDVITMGDYWQGTMPIEYCDVGCLAFYNKENKLQTFDIYQVVKIPAGIYTIKVQSYYREGNPNDTFANYNKGQAKKSVFLYASVLPNEDPESEVVRESSTPICSMASSGQSEMLYSSSLSWASDGNNWVTDAAGNSVLVYYPNCNISSRIYFEAGEYWNSFQIILTEEAWVRLGLRKVAGISEDYVPFSNLQVIYESEADDDALLLAAKEDCRKTLAELEALEVAADKLEFIGLAGIIADRVMELNESIDAAKTMTDVDAVSAEIDETLELYSKSMLHVNNLADLLRMSAAMMASTNYLGLDDFKAAYDKSLATAQANSAAIGKDPVAYYEGIYTELVEARTTYLESQDPDEFGAKDFTALIRYPWFVNPEYTPTLKEDGTWSLDEESWRWLEDHTPDSYSNLVEAGYPDISSDVVLSGDPDVINQWYKRYKTFGDGWSANSYQLYYQGRLIGASQGWANSYDDWEGVCQQLVGLPKGYYGLKALVRGYHGDGKWSDENLPPYHNIFAENSAGVRVASDVGYSDSYYSMQILGDSYGWWEAKPLIWQEHKTGPIYVDDGQLLIGGQSSITADFTGFRLMYYGENPPYDAMIQAEIAAIDKKKEVLPFTGDLNAIDAILSEIKLPLADVGAYSVALAVIADANYYIRQAQRAVNKFNAVQTYESLINDYDFEDALNIIFPPFDYAIGFGGAETDTYDAVDGLNEQANKYAEYMKMYAKAKPLNNAALKSVLAKQEKILMSSATGESSQKLDRFMTELALPYNNALFESMGVTGASEKNPVDVTFLLENPTFAEGPYKGWSGETPTINEYGRENAELWNRTAFTLSQKLAGLPAGTYELRAKAIYRDGGSVTNYLVEEFLAAGNEEKWDNHNAELFAKASDENDQFVYIKAIESLKGTVNSFTEVVTYWDYEYDDDGNEIVVPLTIQTLAPEGEGETYEEATYNHCTEGTYPFDTVIEIDGKKYYYPASMYGFYQWCVQHPEDVTNRVRFTVSAGESVEVGIRKTCAIGSDWVIFDDFELWYLGGDAIQPVLAGDANGDGAVDVTDVVSIVNYILGKPSASFVFAAADVKGDGSVDITDVVSVVNIILGKGAEAKAREAVSISGTMTTINENGNTNLVVDEAKNYVAMQLDVVLPEGRTLMDAQLNSTSNHAMVFNRTGENRYTVLAYSLSNEAFEPTNAALATLLTDGAEASIERATFITTDGRRISMDVSDMATGIANIQ